MSPGDYLTMRRVSAGLSVEDVALSLATQPPVDVRRRIEWLDSLEVDAMPMSMTTALALSGVPRLAIDLALLATLIDDRRARIEQLPFVRFVRDPEAGA